MNFNKMSVLAPDASFWWTQTGTIFDSMMQQAGYSQDVRDIYNSFYFHCIIPALGPRPDDGKQRVPWPSFMTDDHTPIELSWAWENKGGRPEVRLSIEPIIDAMSCPGKVCSDESAIRRLAAKAQPFCQEFDLELFHVFMRRLSVLSGDWATTAEGRMANGHMSQYFAAFDLSPAGITFKVYFLPAQRALRDGVPSWDVVYSAILAASGHDLPMQLALNKLSAFYEACASKYGLKVEIVGSDCIAPAQARVKIYFRTPASSFASVRYIMTMGGALVNANTESALSKLKELWDGVLGRPSTSVDDGDGEGDELPAVDHRTAGILYYFSLRRGAHEPAPKIYIPVRHYAHNDGQVAQGLVRYFGRDATRSYADMLRETL